MLMTWIARYRNGRRCWSKATYVLPVHSFSFEWLCFEPGQCVSRFFFLLRSWIGGSQKLGKSSTTAFCVCKAIPTVSCGIPIDKEILIVLNTLRDSCVWSCMRSFEMYATIKPHGHLLFRFHVGILLHVHSTVMQEISYSTNIRQLQTFFFLYKVFFCYLWI